jgi:hypothetical protein
MKFEQDIGRMGMKFKQNIGGVWKGDIFISYNEQRKTNESWWRI